MLESKNFDYKLIDCGNWHRIEKFGSVTTKRSCPQATWKLKNDNPRFNAFFDKKPTDSTWKISDDLPPTWEMKIGPVKVELRFSPNGQVGIFPEQFDNWRWMHELVQKNPRKKLKILNTFGYTGIATLMASRPHTEVCHVDGAKSAINWAKRNAELSGLADNNIRWICDDVLQFMAREVRRGNHYDGIILDPPAFGRGAKKDWQIERDLPELLNLVEKLLTDKPLFVILTCHAPDHFSADDFADMLKNLKQFRGSWAEKLDLKIPSPHGNALPSSFGARISR